MNALLITIADFHNAQDNRPKTRVLTWVQLVKALGTHEERKQKDGALFSPVRYRPQTKRANGNVELLTLAVGEWDGGEQYSEVARRLKAEGYAFAAYSTYSSTPEHERFRVVVPLAQEVPAPDWRGGARIWARIGTHVFGGTNEQHDADESRMYYYPACPPGALRFEDHADGRALNAYSLPEVPAGPAVSPNGNGHGKPTPGELSGLPIGIMAKDFMTNGAKMGEQRTTACAVARNLHQVGWAVERIADALWLGFQACEQDPSSPWTPEDARKIAEDIGLKPPPPPKPLTHAAEPDLSAAPGDPSAAPGGTEIGITKRIADAILKRDHFAQDAGGCLYIYRNGAYAAKGEKHVAMRTKHLLEAWGLTKAWSSFRASEVAEYIRTDARMLWERPPLDTLNVNNGLVDIETRQLRPHSPDFLSPVQLPIQYQPGATCPYTELFISTTFPEDAQELPYEVAADLMLPDTSRQKTILALGEGANGKSTWLAQLVAFIGKQNCCAMSLHKLETDRFAASRLVGKLANVCPDIPSAHLESTSTFKAITGGDSIPGEYKYREPFDFLPFARLVFSANNPPRSSDASYAFFRRWVVVPFDRVFEGKERIPRHELDARLADPKELSGLLNRALDALPGLRANGFTETDSMRSAWQEFRASTDPLAVWLDRKTEEEPSAYVPKGELVREYNKDCDTHNRPWLTGKAFYSAVRRLRPNIGEAQRVVDGRVVWVWTGLRFRSSLDSLDSLDSPYCCTEQRKVEEGGGVQGGEVSNNNKANPVNRVNQVNAANAEQVPLPSLGDVAFVPSAEWQELPPGWGEDTDKPLPAGGEYRMRFGGPRQARWPQTVPTTPAEPQPGEVPAELQDNLAAGRAGGGGY